MIANFSQIDDSNSNMELSLGLGNDLDPKILRWMVPGGITGFLLWAITSPRVCHYMPVSSTWTNTGGDTCDGWNASSVFNK